MLAGDGVVANGIFYLDDSSVTLPRSSVLAGIPGSPLSSVSPMDSSLQTGDFSSSFAAALTGVYTATNTPSPSQGAASLGFGVGAGVWPIDGMGGPMAVLVCGFAFGVGVLVW